MVEEGAGNAGDGLVLAEVEGENGGGRGRGRHGGKLLWGEGVIEDGDNLQVTTPPRLPWILSAAEA